MPSTRPASISAVNFATTRSGDTVPTCRNSSSCCGGSGSRAAISWCNRAAGDPWFLAHTTGPKAHALEIFRGHGFPDLPSAYWALFKARWEANTGERLVLDEVDDPVIPRPGEGDLTLNASDRPILSYSDVFSTEPGGRIEFKVSVEGDAPYHAEIVRLRCGDDAGRSSLPRDTGRERRYRRLPSAAAQAIDVGSYIDVGQPDAFELESFTLQAYVWPTTPSKGEQAILANWDEDAKHGFALVIDEEGGAALYLGDGKDNFILGTGVPLLERQWYLLTASFDGETRQAWIGQRPLVQLPHGDTTASGASGVDLSPVRGPGLRIAAWAGEGGRYNGKIDSPVAGNRALNGRARCRHGARGSGRPFGRTCARWDFSQEMSGTRIVDVSGNGHDGATVNLPTRA